MYKTTNEIRQMFLDFFCNKGHTLLSSSSLVPYDDNTLLFTNSGMNQFKNIFLGIDDVVYKRVVTVQPCIRSGGKHNDLNKVGYTNCHHTFFEMLGNFSFGDYFKYDAIHFAWELLTSNKWFGIPKEKLFITVYYNDNETYDIWSEKIKIPSNRIICIGDKNNRLYESDNFWYMADVGPCGPCSEILYDTKNNITGNKFKYGCLDKHRYIEIWNLVFMQFNRQVNGELLPLPNMSVDTGMGLERIAAVLQNVKGNYDIDIFCKLISHISKILNIFDVKNKYIRIIADHIRSCVFLINDGVIPSNEGRGYVLRRIIRRAIFYGKQMGISDAFFYKLVTPVIDVMDCVSENLCLNKDIIKRVLLEEEYQFDHTLFRGFKYLNVVLSTLSDNILYGDIAFNIYSTYGLPIDFIKDVCFERNIKFDSLGFDKYMLLEKKRSRASNKFDVGFNVSLLRDYSTIFVGYNTMSHYSRIIAIFFEEKSVDIVSDGMLAIVVLDKTPFYGESGGQIGDCGELKSSSVIFKVNEAKKYGKTIIHIGQVITGTLKVGMCVNAEVDFLFRRRVCSNHSATHLLHSTLRSVLGNHVVQKGSFINDKLLRFDFACSKSLNINDIFYIEKLVNEQIRQNLPVKTELMDLQKAINRNVIALFVKKYEKDMVRVLSIGNYSVELCGGTHVNYTGDIGLFIIVSEISVASGIRRIEAITGDSALLTVHKQRDVIYNLSNLMKVSSNKLFEKSEDILNKYIVLNKENNRLKYESLLHKIKALVDRSPYINNIRFVVSEFKNIELHLLRSVVDKFKDTLQSSVFFLVLFGGNIKQSSIIIGVTRDLLDRLNAIKIMNFVVNCVEGKGGGRLDLVQISRCNTLLLKRVMNDVEGFFVSML